MNRRHFVKLSAAEAKQQSTGEPLDWISNPRREKWKLNGREVGFDWG